MEVSGDHAGYDRSMHGRGMMLVGEFGVVGLCVCVCVCVRRLEEVLACSIVSL
jgi:hypothetical protein